MVQLRLNPQEDLPDDLHVSVRVGEVQKICRLAGKRVYRFPNALDTKYSKIEVFRRIGCVNLSLESAHNDEHDLQVECEDTRFKAIAMKVLVEHDSTSKNVPEGSLSPEETSVNKQEERAAKTEVKLKSAKEYLGKHSIEVKLSEAMQAVLKERPEDPAAYIAHRLVGYVHPQSTIAQGNPQSAAIEAAPSETDEAKAATKIQATFRGRQERKSLKQDQEPALEQAAPTNEAKEQQRLEENAAATKLQAMQRGKRDRALVAAKKEELQKQKEEEEEEKAAVRIQAMHRGKQDRAAVAKRRSEMAAQQEKVVEAPAAETSAEETPGGQDFVLLQQQEAAATKIQSIQRGKRDRAVVAARREELKSKYQQPEAVQEASPEEQEAAALKIQSIRRGKKSRGEVAAMKASQVPAKDSAAIEEPSGVAAGVQEATLEEQEAAAIKIQSIRRGNKSREELASKAKERENATQNEANDVAPVAEATLAEQEAAALKIQSIRRGQKGRESVAALKAKTSADDSTVADAAPEASLEEQEKAATKIQAIHRGKHSRAEVAALREHTLAATQAADTAAPDAAAPVEEEASKEEQEAAALRIQAIHRGRKSREEVAAMRANQAESG
mmetsp:Transcript_15336/g.33151  ORF Transcript_15336/g.33151 Transcript_15336/m.33151 type:complete len:614 (+) Transcript_15336:614-2455(+)|eukprot:CAMPEP_0206446308 /NCGR_PEP_ID=MMETSP0324_2-20121206/16056_1 /ASSEMBLY_ACC=CAM_ASM_000836 /TAXON_ID=2866 /ORGANISM="Crypthecodinium cohnii, Strain Seligo" /LENGTH=613 /DNA_ID=CAMNT_0053914749 /DNA_START=493 /DNA_END=2334 /DNA_ORIENTATION=+